MTKYTDFISALQIHLWKQGDTLVTQQLPRLIRLADQELNTVLRVEERVVFAKVVTSFIPLVMPTNYKWLRSVTSPLSGEMKYNIPADFLQKRANKTLTDQDYFMVNKNFYWNAQMLGSSTVSLAAPATFDVLYYKQLGQFISTPDAYLPYDSYEHLYTYCVLRHAAPFLREDERIATWQAMYEQALGPIIEEQAEIKYAGSPLKMKFSGIR